MAIDLEALRKRLAEKKLAEETSTAPTPATHHIPAPSTVVPAIDTHNTRYLQALQKAKETIAEDTSLGDSEKLQKEIEASELFTKLEELDVRIKAAHPLMPTLLRDIHTTLRKQPDNITLLSDEQVNVVVRGLLKQTTTVIATKKVSSKSKSTKGITIDDL